MRSTVFLLLGKALLGLFLGVYVVDAWVGWLDAGQAESDSSVFMLDGELGITNRPHFRDATQHLDSLGLRNPEIPPDAPPREVRIVVAGASNVYGLGVKDDETWRVHLEADLGAGGAPIRVLNAAVQGFSIVQECRWAARLIGLLEPDLVVVFLHANRQALLDNSLAHKWTRIGDAMVPTDLVRAWPTSLHWIPVAIHRLMQHSHLYVRHRTLARLGRGAAQDILFYVLSEQPVPPVVQDSMDEALGEIEALVALARRRGVELRFVLAVEAQATNDRVWGEYLVQYAPQGAPPLGTPRREPLDALARWIAPTGAITWDFYPVLSTLGADWDTYILRRILHWSPAGHALVAGELARRIRAGGLLEDLIEAREASPRAARGEQ